MWQRFLDPSSELELNQPTIKSDGCALALNPCRADQYHNCPETQYSVFIPENYEPNYRYPLVVYLHDDECSELSLDRWFPAITDTNFLGLGIRAPFLSQTSMPGRYRWQFNRPEAGTAVLRDALKLFVLDWNIHPDRIVLLGEGTGAVTALQIALLQNTSMIQDLPMLAGTICENPSVNWTKSIPSIASNLSGRVLFTSPAKTSPETETVTALGEAGIEITNGIAPSQTKHQAINHWIMSMISTTVY